MEEEEEDMKPSTGAIKAAEKIFDGAPLLTDKQHTLAVAAGAAIIQREAVEPVTEERGTVLANKLIKTIVQRDKLASALKAVLDNHPLGAIKYEQQHMDDLRTAVLAAKEALDAL